MNRNDDTTKKGNSTGTTDKQKKHSDDDTKNTGFRSSRIRDKESRTSETGDPSVS